MLTLDEWRRKLLELQRAERETRAALVAGMDPLAAERAYEALKRAERALDEHYRIRPPDG